MRREVKCRCHDWLLGYYIEEPKEDDSIITPCAHSTAGLFGAAHDMLQRMDNEAMTDKPGISTAGAKTNIPFPGSLGKGTGKLTISGPRSTVIELREQLGKLKNQAQMAHEQGRSAKDIPLTVADGIELLTVLLKVADEAATYTMPPTY